MELDLANAVLGALVQTVGASAGRRLMRTTSGSAVQAALNKAVWAAVEPALTPLLTSKGATGELVRAAVADRLENRLDVDPATMADPATMVAAWLAPLAEPVEALDGCGFLAYHHIDADVLADRLVEQILRRVMQDAMEGGPLTPLWTELAASRRDRASINRDRGLDAKLTRLIAQSQEILAQFGAPTSGRKARCRVGVIPSAASSFQSRAVADRLANQIGGGGTVVHTHTPASPREVSTGSVVRAEVAVLIGMGGIGKTQLAAAYARSAWQQGHVRVLVWVAASSRDQIVAAYAQAAAELGLIDGTAGAPVAAERFLAWLPDASVPWLVVLDDVQDPGDVQGLWPPAGHDDGGMGRVVVTTRRRDAALAGRGQVIEVDVFTPAEARAYLTGKLAAHHRIDDAEQIDRLAADLGHLPLALAQAVAYLIDAGLEVATYRARLADRRRTLAELVPEPSSLPDDHQLIVAATWSLSIQRADAAHPAGLARPLLQLASLLDSNSIPQTALVSRPALDYLAECRAGVISTASSGIARYQARKREAVVEQDARDGLRVLHRFSLIDHDPTSPWQEVRVHQLIQRATCESFTPTAMVGAAHAVANALDHIWPQVERDQAGPVLRANTIALASATGTALWQWHNEAHPILYRAARSLGEAGQVQAAIDEYTRLHTTALHLFGPDHIDTLSTHGSMEYWRGRAGDAAGAAVATAELLEDCLRVLGPDHPDTLCTRSNLARWQGEAGDATGAAAAFTELLADRLRLLGPDHPQTLSTCSDLAHWQGLAGGATGAAIATAELLTDRLRVLGPDHPHTLTTRDNLAYWRSEAVSIDDPVETHSSRGDVQQLPGPSRERRAT
ncbi:NB-ARC domain-containing protein [Spongiactinospora sp. 9N601]|uniref:NB-ARC domain-containing protein n=1 Tax=Spongiactinospora sp. 9N601 TaxID=3375149 RepID=UPI0037971BB1